MIICFSLLSFINYQSEKKPSSIDSIPTDIYSFNSRYVAFFFLFFIYLFIFIFCQVFTRIRTTFYDNDKGFRGPRTYVQTDIVVRNDELFGGVSLAYVNIYLFYSFRCVSNNAVVIKLTDKSHFSHLLTGQYACRKKTAWKHYKR